MKKLKDHLHIIVIILGILIIMPIMYYFLYALPSYNQQKLELERDWKNAQIENMEKEADIKRKEDEQAESEKQSNKIALNSCLEQSEKIYLTNWVKACKSQASRMVTDYEQCLIDYKFIESAVNQKVEDYCAWRKEGADSGDDCSLNKNTAEGIENYRKQQKDECYKKYPIK